MATVAVLVAHPDDEVLGVGGTIRRHVEAGDHVHVHIECMSGLRHTSARMADAQMVASDLGYELTFGDSAQLGTRPMAFDDIADIIYTHHPQDLNRDHRLVAEAALVAGRFAKTIRTFETVSSTEWGLAPFEPDYFVAIDIDAKLKALEEYASEMREPPHPRSLNNVTALAELRGSVVGLEHAEAFHTVRDTWR